MRIAKVGLWEWDIQADTAAFSPEWKHQLGYSDNEITDRFSEWESRVDPEDLTGLKANLADVLATPSAAHFEAEFRMRHKDGSWRWILCQADVLRDGGGQGRPIRLIGGHTDITERKRSVAEQNEREANARAAELLESITDMVVSCDRAGDITYVNERAAQSAGRPREDLPGKPIGTVLPELVGADGCQRISQAMANQVPVHFELFVPLQGRWFESQVVPTHDGASLHCRDITDRKQAEVGRHQRDDGFRAVGENDPDPVARYDRDCRFAYVNPACQRLLQLPVSQLTGRTPVEVYPEDEGVRVFQERLQEVLTTATPLQFENMVTVLGGGGFATWHLIRMTPERDAAGRVVSVLCITRDISTLKETERQFRTLTENSPDIIARFDRAGCYLYANLAVERITGVPATEVYGKRFDEVFGAGRDQPSTPSDAIRVRLMIERVFATKAAIELEVRLPLPAGDRFFDVRLMPETDAVGQVVSVLHIGRDITERKTAERQLALVNFALNRVREAAYLIDESSRFLYVNDESCRVLGYRHDELLELSVADIGPEFPMANWSGHWQDLKTAGSLTFETVHRTKNGGILPVEVTANYFEYDGVGYNLALVRDISLRKQAEVALHESEQRFRQVTENIDEVFWLTETGDQRIVYISPAYEKVWGRSCESLHVDPQSWMDAIHPEDQERVKVELGRLRAGEGYDVEYRILRPDDSVRWIQDRAFPVKDTDGAVRRIAGVATDITTRRQLEDQFRQAQKMDAIGQLAGGIAHDFNNLLAVIQMQSSFLLHVPADADYMKEGIQQIMAAAERAANLTRQLLTFSRRSARQVKVMDLGEVADHMIKLLARLLGETIALKTAFEPSLPSINADPGMMEQVLMNLAVNARDAMPGGGQLTIAVSALNIGEDSISAHPHAVPGEYVRLSVSDTGCGIPRQNLARIFEPFFTTKEVGRGTGLGLATVFGIVEQHRGWIEVSSEVNQGTTFDVFFPALPRTASPAAPGREHTLHTGGNETILLVEDEPSVRDLAAMVLERYGYHVLVAGSAVEALRCWETRTGNIDLLLTDIVMPGGMSGRELGKQLARLCPGLKVVYTSGYNPEMANPGRLSMDETGTDDFLQKPYSVSDLASIVRRNLEKAAPILG